MQVLTYGWLGFQTYMVGYCKGFLQYWTASANTQFSVRISNRGIVVSAVSTDCLVVSLRVVRAAAVPSRAFSERDLVLPGDNHFNLVGFTSPYPGHSTPEKKHLLQAGSVESQTRQRRLHSQQWRLSRLAAFRVVALVAAIMRKHRLRECSAKEADSVWLD